MLKPFDLQAALSGAKVVTRDGREVKIASVDYSTKQYSNVIGWIEGTAASWDITGKNWPYDKGLNFDIFMAPTERKEWVVRDDKYNAGPCFFGPFETFEKAKKYVDYEGGTIHEITIHE